jgi:hypothetical protein
MPGSDYEPGSLLDLKQIPPPLPPTMVDLEGNGGFFKRYYFSHYLPGVLMDQVLIKKM